MNITTPQAIQALIDNGVKLSFDRGWDLETFFFNVVIPLFSVWLGAYLSQKASFKLELRKTILQEIRMVSNLFDNLLKIDNQIREYTVAYLYKFKTSNDQDLKRLQEENLNKTMQDLFQERKKICTKTNAILQETMLKEDVVKGCQEKINKVNGEINFSLSILIMAIESIDKTEEKAEDNFSYPNIANSLNNLYEMELWGTKYTGTLLKELYEEINAFEKILLKERKRQQHMYRITKR